MTMDWVSIAILGTIILGLVNIFDSHLIAKRMPSLRAYLLPVSIVIFIYSLITFCLFPLPEGVDTWPLVVAIASGILRATSVAILLYILKTEEVSWAIPLFHTYPVFVAIVAVPLLGETLGYLHWLAIIIVVTGAVIISAKRSPGGSNTWLGRSFFLLLAAGLLMAIADVASKYALGYISFWNMYWIGSFCLSGIYLLVTLRPSIFRELGSMPWRRPAMALIVVNETLAMIGIVLVFWAMESGPVSLVSTIAGSRPIFVFMLALILNSILPNFLLDRKSDRYALAIRLIATAMIAGGIAIIYLA
jgi:drug/metabolite transporter (DMT)-like permease